jgi:hypothetical protein
MKAEALAGVEACRGFCLAKQLTPSQLRKPGYGRIDDRAVSRIGKRKVKRAVVAAALQQKKKD